MVAEHDAAVIIDALAEPVTLLVFGAIVTATSTAHPHQARHSAPNTTATTYITPFGLQQQLSLSCSAIEWAAERLEQAGLLDVVTDHERGYDSWRINEGTLTAVSAQLNKPNYLRTDSQHG
ncbi:MAG: hypothetical protein JXJ30_03655 [Halothiobacillaceae bacterium]|nr:hypothetical protein [Halothiobacillaceae bacterium]